jgi:chromosomal replication initiation ATPase DnaA
MKLTNEIEYSESVNIVESLNEGSFKEILKRAISNFELSRNYGADPDFAFIKKAVCEVFQIKPEMLKIKTRMDPIKTARHFFYYYAVLLNDKYKHDARISIEERKYRTLTEIGAACNQSHCNVLNCVQRIDALLSTNDKYITTNNEQLKILLTKKL